MEYEGNQRLWPIVVMLFLVYLMTGYFSCLELSYRLWGQTAEATVVRMTEESDSTCRMNYRGPPSRRIEYRFVDSDGTPRNGRMTRGSEESRYLAVGRPIRIQYVAAINQSRALGDSYSIPVYIFIPSSVLLFCGLYLAWLWRRTAGGVGLPAPVRAQIVSQSFAGTSRER